MKSIDELLEREPGLEYLGLTNLKKVHWNYCTPILYEHAVKNKATNLRRDTFEPFVFDYRKTSIVQN